MNRHNAKNRGSGSKCNGFSLLEVITASIVLVITVVGTSSYSYYSALDQRKGAMQTSAARTALLLYESWRGLQGATTYNPTTWNLSGVSISAGSGPAAPSGFTALGSYSITTNNFTYTATLSWQDISAGLRALNVIIAWSTSGSSTPDNSYTLTSYTLR